MHLISHLAIRKSFLKQLCQRNIKENISETLVNSLLNASLFGIDSHGINLFSHYLDCVDNGRILANNEPRLQRVGSNILCDASFGFSHYAVQSLLNELDIISDESGIAIGTIVNSDHIGAVGIHSANSGLVNKIILGFTNADALASTPDGKKSVFGTNPISLIYRKSESELLYIDMASTLFSMNKVKNYRRNKQILPPNVARDKNGLFTTDPNKVSSLEPIGSHKGFALAFLIEILTAGITGRDFSAEILPMYGSSLKSHRQLSHTYLVINPHVQFLSTSSNNDHVWELIQKVRKSLHPDQCNQSPGVKEMSEMKNRLANGVPVLDEIYNEWIERGIDL